MLCCGLVLIDFTHIFQDNCMLLGNHMECDLISQWKGYRHKLLLGYRLVYCRDRKMWCWLTSSYYQYMDPYVGHSIKLPEVMLTHWGRVTHICVNKITIIGSDNGLSPGRRQAIIWTIAGILLIEPRGTSFNRNSIIFIHENEFESVVCEMAAILFRPQCVKALPVGTISVTGKWGTGLRGKCLLCHGIMMIVRVSVLFLNIIIK